VPASFTPPLVPELPLDPEVPLDPLEPDEPLEPLEPDEPLVPEVPLVPLLPGAGSVGDVPCSGPGWAKRSSELAPLQADTHEIRENSPETTRTPAVREIITPEL
jgi:hypothetical protein